MKKKVLITGISGQDGSYLAEFLLSKNYEVYGLSRASIHSTYNKLSSVLHRVSVIEVDYFDLKNLREVFRRIGATEVYHLAAFTSPGDFVTSKQQLIDKNRKIYSNILNSFSLLKNAKLFNASTSHIFSPKAKNPINISSKISPVSPYGIYKAQNYLLGCNIRKDENKYIVNGILFNHESPRRTVPFVTAKIAMFAKNIKKGKKEILSIGNMDVARDWGHAKEFVEGMWLSLQQKTPRDYIFCTGIAYTVRDFIEMSLKCIGVKIKWEGPRGSMKEIGINCETKEKLVEVNPNFFREDDYMLMVGDTKRTSQLLGWKAKISFESLVAEMVRS